MYNEIERHNVAVVTVYTKWVFPLIQLGSGTVDRYCVTHNSAIGDAIEHNQLFENINEVDIPGISRIIRNRMTMISDALNHGKPVVYIPDHVYLLIDLMSNGPGCALVMLYHLLETMSKRYNKIPIGDNYAIVTPAIFMDAFGIFYNCSYIKADEVKWLEKWDAQKDEKGHNKVDDISYWKELFRYEQT